MSEYRYCTPPKFQAWVLDPHWKPLFVEHEKAEDCYFVQNLFQIPVILESKNVGENLQDHLTTMLGPFFVNQPVVFDIVKFFTPAVIWQFLAKGTGIDQKIIFHFQGCHFKVRPAMVCRHFSQSFKQKIIVLTLVCSGKISQSVKADYKLWLIYPKFFWSFDCLNFLGKCP